MPSIADRNLLTRCHVCIKPDLYVVECLHLINSIRILLGFLSIYKTFNSKIKDKSD